MAPESIHRVPGVTVYPRGRKWAYTIYGEKDLVTGKRDRVNESGHESEDAAWVAALRKHAEMKRGRTVKPSARTVEVFLMEWLGSIRHALKPTAYENYATNVRAYIVPKMGPRKLREVSVPMLNTFYVQLLESGRVKPDNNRRMYQYWAAHRDQRNGLGPTPIQLSSACGTTHQAAKAAVLRYRRGRVPEVPHGGLSAKSVRNIHRLLHRALKDAVAWDYLTFNPAEHASLPRERRRRKKTTPEPWTVEELSHWLTVAMADRFAALWVLDATTGMRRSELLGVRRNLLDLDRGLLAAGGETLVSVGGRAEESDGKSEAGDRIISLDVFTVAMLRTHLAMLDEERAAFGAAYRDDGWLFVWPDGNRPHPDSVTARFNRLVDRAGVRRIRLHDIRHTYATLTLNAGVAPKILSDRIGHSNPGITFQVYTHRSTGLDRPAADLIGTMVATAVQRQLTSGFAAESENKRSHNVNG